MSLSYYYKYGERNYKLAAEKVFRFSLLEIISLRLELPVNLTRVLELSFLRDHKASVDWRMEILFK